MIFGSRAPGEAVGALLAHTLRVDGKVFAKGAPVTAEAAAVLAAAGHAAVAVAVLEPGDVAEGEAAARIAAALAVPGLRCTRAASGRCSLAAEADGLAMVGREALRALNLLAEDVTIATVPAETTVKAGDLVATVKIIPFAVPGGLVEACVAQAAAVPPLRFAPFRARRARLIATVQDGRPSGPTDALRARIAAHHVAVEAVETCAHDPAAVAACLRGALAQVPDLVLVLGASASSDRRDVIPAAIAAAGGMVERLGMPADPGNLLALGRCGGVPVLVVPGCARAPAANGFDLVLRRLAADLPVGAADVADLALGGLLKGRGD